MTDRETREAGIVVKNRAGLHARPSSAIVMAVAASDCSVRIRNEASGEESDAGSLSGLLALAALPGTRLRIRVTGKEAGRLLATLVGMFESGFGEDG